MNHDNLKSALSDADISSSGGFLKAPEGRLFGYGTTVGNGVEGWAPSAIFIHTDGATASTRVYMNEGTIISASWTSIYTAGAALTLDGAFDNGTTINGAVSEATAMKIGGATDYFTLWQEGVNDIRIGTSTGANISIIPAGGTLALTGAMTISGALTVGGAITFASLTSTGLITASGGIAGDGFAIADTTGAITISGTGAITVASGGITLTAGDLTIATATNYLYAAKIAAASASNVNLVIDAAGSGTISLGSTSTGAITLARATSLSSTLAVTGITTATGAIYANGGVDRSAAATLSIGATNANAITISKSGVTTTVAGVLAVSETTTLTGDVTIGSSKVTVTAASGNTVIAGTLNVGSDGAGADVKFFDSASGDYLLYDVSESVLISEDVIIQLMDDTVLKFGDDSDWTVLNVSGSSNALQIDAAADDAVLNIGVAKRVDLVVKGANANMTFDSSADALLFATGGCVKIGGTAARAGTAGTNFLSIFNGTAPVGTLANGVTLYSETGEAKIMDAAGNSTTISPHDDDNLWVFDSIYTPTGKRLLIHMEKLVRKIVDEFGWEGLIEESIVRV